MTRRKTIIFLATFLCAVLSVNSKTVAWKVMPQYDEIKPFAEGLYLIKFGDKWGLMNSDCEILLTPSFDVITETNGDYPGLLINIESKKYRVNSFIYPNGTIKDLKGKYYAIPQYTDFSEDKLPISNASGKQGFLDSQGMEVVACQFDKVHPFCEGLASVTKDLKVKYIREGYDSDNRKNELYSQWNEGLITFGSSFKNGQAVVGYDGKYHMIDRAGRSLGNYKGSPKLNKINHTVVDNRDDRQAILDKVKGVSSTIVPENGGTLIAVTDNGIQLTPALFEKVEAPDANGNCVVSKNGKFGILRIIDGEIKSNLTYKGGNTSTIKLEPSAKPGEMTYAFTFPESQRDKLSVWIDKGNGEFVNITDMADGTENSISYNFDPFLEKDKKSLTIQSKVFYDEMELYSDSKDFDIIRQASLRVSAPVTTSAYADIKTEAQYVTASVYNDSDTEITVNATLTVNCSGPNRGGSRSVILNIPPHSSRSIQVGVHVERDGTASASISASCGESRASKSSTVNLRIY